MGKFVKGHKVNLGKKNRLGLKNTVEQNEHIREAHLKRKAFLGYVHTPESKRKLSLALKGKRHSEESIRKATASRILWYEKNGKKPKCSDCGKLLASYSAKKCVEHKGIGGELHHNWKGGLTETNKLIRNSRQYARWRKAVFERDDYICQFCGLRGGVLNADHVKPFAKFPELRFELSNGRTLCEPCHRSTPTYGGRRVSV